MPYRQPKPFIKKEQTTGKPSPKKKMSKKQKKPIVCYKCGKTGHKSFQCKMEQKINELLSGEPELQKNCSFSLFKTNLKKMKMSIILSLV